MRAMGRISSLTACVDAESGRESPGRARGNPGPVAASGVSSHTACGRRPLPARWWLLRVQRCRSTGGPTLKTLIALLAWFVLFLLGFPLALLGVVLWRLAWMRNPGGNRRAVRAGIPVLSPHPAFRRTLLAGAGRCPHGGGCCACSDVVRPEARP